MHLSTVDNSSNGFYSFCEANDLYFKKDEIGRLVFEGSSYDKIKNHPEVYIKYIKKGGLLTGGSEQKGFIQIGYERRKTLVILTSEVEIVNHLFISSAIISRPHVERAKKLSSEGISESISKPLVIPSDCPKIQLDNSKLSLIMLSGVGDRFFFKKEVTEQRLSEILKLEKDIYKRKLGWRLFFLFILVVISLKFLNII